MDMSGNVWEWCLNEYSDPKNFGLGRTEWRVLRGGGWFFNQDPARAVYRHYLDPRHWFNHLGFRVVCARPPSL
jgi:formylglycine-generating enzyme required for sulfatase activity